ncbi:2-keto-4-pentenoate hydratase [Pseudomonas bijieensis]|uniref:2-keto-4-pentenoate hydratase n=1 Tax=Pseudomonas bijieensis TaxID=2681983 RepID=UPI001E4D070F|nr:fumarylacetoacetate hydrolase family protein [Pseudomonas bijieensis]MCD9117155.1 fumarylacetoacetate hydrolase family protein [Pseudomonas bijieensis]
MSNEVLNTAAHWLEQAAQTREWIAPLRESLPSMTIEDAYAVQKINIGKQLANGRRIVGRKIGLTSKVVQVQLGVDQPDFGALLDNMGYGCGETIPWNTLHQPKVEAEIAFVLKSDLDFPNPSLVDVINAVDYALPAIEVVGSRIDKWNIRIVDTIADNASSGAYVLGTTPQNLKDLDLALCGMVMERRGEPVSTGVGLACLGNPLNAVVWLARKMVEVGQPLRAGDLVLSGALGPMVEVQPGDIVEARINGLGSVTAVFGAAQGVSA